MTREEFEISYAEGSGLTVEELRALHLVPFPCQCEADICQGWQMLYQPPGCAPRLPLPGMLSAWGGQPPSPAPPPTG